MANNNIDLDLITDSQSSLGNKFSTIVQYFFEDSEMYLDAIKQGIANNKIDSIIYGSHTLKSSSKVIGALKISELSKELESLAINIKDSQGAIDAQVEQLLEALKEELKNSKSEYQKIGFSI